MILELFHFIKRMSSRTRAPPAKNVIIFLKRFNVWGRPRVGKWRPLEVCPPPWRIPKYPSVRHRFAVFTNHDTQPKVPRGPNSELTLTDTECADSGHVS